MRREFRIVLILVALAGTASPASGQRFPGSEEEERSGFGVNVTGGYSFMGGEVGDSIGSGFTLDGSAYYDLGPTPVRVGAGASYGWLGFDRGDGTLEKLSLYGLAAWKFMDLESVMTPYVTGRLGWTQLSDERPCGLPRCGSVENPLRVVEGTRTRSGFEVGASVGVEYPVSRKLSLDIGGRFDWTSVGDYHLEGQWADDGAPVSDTLPDTSASGSEFSLYAGVFYYFSP
jgi:hypothetical protein